jgi:pimeloyl-ACP methyl ester carboxylesterase
MPGGMTQWISRIRPRAYGRKPSLVLVNGLAEQPESWYKNHRFWRRYFDVYMPNVLVYDGEAIHERLKRKQAISVEYLVEQLHYYLTHFVQSPPYHIVASSLGGKVTVEFAVKYPELCNRLVLLCPSGMGDDERLPIVEGVKKNDMRALVESVFHRPMKHADSELVKFYKRSFPNRRWQVGMLKAVQHTKDHSVRNKMSLVQPPTLLISGANDRICDPKEAQSAARELPQGHFLKIPRCGHAPQIEKAWKINRLVVHFLTHPQPTSKPSLAQLLLLNAAQKNGKGSQ